MAKKKTNANFKIFRAGRHTSMSGLAIEFTEKELDQIVQAYDPKLHEAPVVIGHPQDNSPAYGWVGSLGREGDLLSADARELSMQFVEAVREGLYKKISASFYLPDSPNNPTPGGYYLRHVGFLGAAPPAVKGLPQVEFSEGESTADFVELEFNELDVAHLFRSLREWLIEKHGIEEADKALPPWLLNWTQNEAAEEVLGDGSYADPAPGQITLLKKKETAGQGAPSSAPRQSAPSSAVSFSEGEISERERRIAAREADLAARERTQKRSEHASFLDHLIAQGRPLPCGRELLLDLCDALEFGPGVVSFAEGARPVDVFKKQLLGNLPKQIDFTERAPSTGENTDPELSPEQIGREAQQYADEMKSKGVFVSATDAVAHVKKTKGIK